jgi:competence protein ComEC
MSKANHQAMPALKLAVVMCTGILAGRQFPVTDSCLTVLTVFLVIASLILLLLLTRHGIHPEGILFLATALVCFFGGAAKIVADRQMTVVVPDSMSHQAVVVGRVREAPTVTNGRTRFALDARALIHKGEQHVLRATIVVTLVSVAHDSVVPHIDFGMLVALLGTVEPPTQERNPGEFSPREYYEANGVSLLMTVRGAAQVHVLESNGGSWLMREIIVPVRRAMLAQIDSTVRGEEGEFLKGLMIGDRSGISQATRQAFMNSGVAHVLAVSGSNVVVVASIFSFIIGLVRLPERLSTAAVLAGLLAYMVITGNQPPVVRATIMAFVLLLARVFQQRSNAYNAMGVSAILILGADARQMFDIGFQLSFGAVLSIIYLYPKTNAWISLLPARSWWQRGILWLLRICAVSLVATLGTLPLTAVSFGRVSVIGIAANIVVIPAVELSVVLGFASACTGVISTWVAGVYAAVNGFILTWTLRIIQVAGNLSFAYVDTTTFAPVDALPFYTALFVAFHHKGRSCVFGVIAFLLALNIAVYVPRGYSAGIPPGTVRVSFIDVGQGDAILAELPGGKSVLIDAGPRTWQFDSGELIVTPFLKRRGISTIDLMVLSHGHSDHVGGVASLLRNFHVRRVASLGELPRNLKSLKNSGGCADLWCDTIHAGMSLLTFPEARLYAMYPFDVRAATENDTASDNRCIVVKLQYGGVSFLFTGDADAAAESNLVQAYGPFLHANLLKAGHHGSSTSSSAQFLETVHPSAVAISVGKNNKFHHPSPVVVERLRAMCGTPARTDEEGALIYETDGARLWRVTWR